MPPGRWASEAASRRICSSPTSGCEHRATRTTGERGIAWRAADSLSLRDLLGIPGEQAHAGSFDAVQDAKADRPGTSGGLQLGWAVFGFGNPRCLQGLVGRLLIMGTALIVWLMCALDALVTPGRSEATRNVLTSRYWLPSLLFGRCEQILRRQGWNVTSPTGCAGQGQVNRRRFPGPEPRPSASRSPSPVCGRGWGVRSGWPGGWRAGSMSATVLRPTCDVSATGPAAH
jgi:hypothetical protein